MDFFNDHAVAFALVCAGVAVGFGLYFTWWLLQQPAGSERMQEIARAVQEGAAAYLRRQYTTIAAVAVVPFLAIGFYHRARLGDGDRLRDRRRPLGGGGLHRHERRRALERPHRGGREARACGPRSRSRSGPARSRAFWSSASASSVAPGYYCSSRARSATAPSRPVDGSDRARLKESLISVFARLGGGIFTGTPDVGADLVGKIEAGIPEDDPRNPAVIADNVGDNVGDCAGMAADLFETYAVTAVAVMLLGHGVPARRTCRSTRSRSAASRSSPP